MYKAIGMIELTSIARGIYATDLMIKAAFVDVASATPVCPGKYIAIVYGDVGAVQNAVSVGMETAGEFLVDSIVIPNIHPDVFPAITATSMPEKIRALGIMESFSIATMIIAADAALKAAAVQAMELRLGSGLGGKAYFTFTGEVSAVDSAVRAGKAIALEKGLLVDVETIPSPSKKLIETLF